jgi:hypothetical protein
MARLLALVIGCDYEGASQPELADLRGAENDAQQMAALLAAGPQAGGALARLTLLLGAEATTDNIRAALKHTLATQGADDTLLFYFAGHGNQEDAGLVLYTWDADYPAADLLGDLGADPRPTAIVLDCCEAGSIAASKEALYRRMHRAPPPGLTARGIRNVQILGGARAGESAREARGQGFFTSALLRALRAGQGPPLLALPLDLSAWRAALPANLLDPGTQLLDRRGVLGAALPAEEPPPPMEPAPAPPAEEPGTPPAESNRGRARFAGPDALTPLESDSQSGEQGPWANGLPLLVTEEPGSPPAEPDRGRARPAGLDGFPLPENDSSDDEQRPWEQRAPRPG